MGLLGISKLGLKLEGRSHTNSRKDENHEEDIGENVANGIGDCAWNR